MTTNAVVLSIVALVVALVMVGVVAGFRYKLRAERRLLGGTSILDEVVEDARVAGQGYTIDDTHVPPRE